MKIIRNPWNRLFNDLVSSCNNSIKITSPFVKENVVSNLFKVKKENVSFSLITSFKLMNYYVGASDLKALDIIIKNNGKISNHQKLHSKIYIFDDNIAIISSGNLTNGGLINNYEYGLLIDDKTMLLEITDDYKNLLNDEITGEITSSEINQAKDIIANVPKTTPITLPEINKESQSEEIEIFTGGSNSIATSLKGWKLDVFNCVNTLKKTEFTLTDLYSFEDVLFKLHPNNNTVKDKMRQQLQDLRDIGLIEFLGNGRYKKLWN